MYRSRAVWNKNRIGDECINGVNLELFYEGHL